MALHAVVDQKSILFAPKYTVFMNNNYDKNIVAYDLK